MKFLCIHGMGTSALIFERELKGYTEALGCDNEYVFVNGAYECAAAPDLGETAPPPYFCHYKTLSSEMLRAAHKEILDVIEEEGPFDAAIGFSQGSALLLSILMHHEVVNGLERPPFKFAVFFSATIAISPDQKFGQKYIEEYAKYYDHDRDLTKGVKKPVKAPKTRAALVLPNQKQLLVAQFQDLLAQAVQSAIDNGEVGAQEYTDGIKGIDSFPRVFHPFMCTERVSIPTVHVVGKDDPYKLQADIAFRLCDKTIARTFEHKGSHNVPRGPKDIKKIAKLMESAWQQANRVGFQY